jgi:Flp pilus assembly protein TadG
MFVGLLLAGLVFDGGAAMTTKASALSVAQQAARAGADQLDLATLRATGEVHLDPAAAEQAAASWLAQAGQTGTIAATTEQVTVTVTATGSAVLLSVVGITSYELSATATAEAVQP